MKRQSKKRKEGLIVVGGSTSSKVREAFLNICPSAERALAGICAEGLEKHNDNWRDTTDPQKFKMERLNHLINHLNLYRIGDITEDHMAKVVWGAMAILHFDMKCDCHKVMRLQK